jgi:hypothetical protein
MKTYYLSLIDQPRSHSLLISDEDPQDINKAHEYENIIETNIRLINRCMIFPMYIIPSEDLHLFKKYAIVIENQEIISIPNYEEIIPENYYSKSEEIVGPPDYSDEEYEN